MNNRFAGNADRCEIRQTAASQVLVGRNVAPPAQFDELLQRRTLRKSDDSKIARMDTQQQSRIFADRLFVIPDPRSIRGSDLAEKRSATAHDIGYAEGLADFNQFATR